mgnify:CR=1 FL=1
MHYKIEKGAQCRISTIGNYNFWYPMMSDCGISEITELAVVRRKSWITGNKKNKLIAVEIEATVVRDIVAENQTKTIVWVNEEDLKIIKK